MTVSHTADNQQAVIAFLACPASYGLGDAAVEQVATHCSIVFLAADRAYKLKRAIRYASLDYTGLAARRAACEAELVLNRRTAPELYFGVRAITRDAAGVLAFDGVGQVLDHVVVMRRFAQSDLFDAMAERGALTRDLMRDLGGRIARFHLAAAPAPGHGGSEAVGRVIADNARELALVATALDGAAVDTLNRHARTALASLAPLLDRRRAGGKVRRCHGDLRLANICLHAGHPTLFDCIEFSDEIGCIDVLYDLAFLLMDLHMRGRGDLANTVFNAYADIAPDAEGLPALPLFLALRAATRGYALAGSAARQADASQAARRMVLARQHVEAGLRFLTPALPRLIALGGDREGARRDLAEQLAGRVAPPPGARIVHLASAGEAGWHEASSVLAGGCSVLLEAEFRDAAERVRARKLASAAGVVFEERWQRPVDIDQCAARQRAQSSNEREAGHDSEGRT